MSDATDDTIPKAELRSLRIVELSGVDRPCHAPALVALMKRAATNSTPPTATNKVTTMTPAEYEAKIAELEAKLTEMTPATKAEGDPAMTLEQALARIVELETAEAEREALKSEPAPEELAKAADPVVYTCDDGTPIVKSAGDLAVRLAKRLDASERVVKAEQMARELVELRKRAADTLGALAGNDDAHVDVLRAVESITDVTKRASAIATLKAANDLMVAKGKAPGASDAAEPSTTDATAIYEASIQKRMADAGESRAQAVAFVQSTPEFGRLYKAMSTKSTK